MEARGPQPKELRPPDAAELYRDRKLTLRQIAKASGLSTTSVYYRLREAGAAPRGEQSLPPELVAKYVADDDFSVRDVGEAAGVSIESAYRLLHRAGVFRPKHKRHGEKRERNGEIHRRRAAGEPLESIARSLGVSKQRVQQIVARGNS